MSGRYLLGIDIGTYSSKASLVAEDGTVAARASVEHALSLPHPGWAEHDPESVWWKDFLELCGAILSRSRVPPSSIAAVGISTISPAVVVVDETGRALRPAILYGIDTRATKEIAELEAATGASLSSQSAAPKILWIRRNEPEVWKRTRAVLNGSGYLNLRLTGEKTIDVYDASIFAPLYDPATRAWSDTIAPLVAPAEMMPRVTWTAEIAGRITAEAARVTGLAAGTPVITGTADAAAEAVSTGLARPGDMMVMYGSSTFFLLATDRLVPAPGFWSSRFLEKDGFVVAGGTAVAGGLTRWFRDTFGADELAAEKAGKGNAYARLAEMAAGSPAGARGLIALPYFSGERTPLNDPDARGMIFGLTLSHSRADVYRSLLESVGYAIRHNVEALTADGCAPRRILAVGGGTFNALWMQIVSDITGLEQEIPAPLEGASYGDAFLAGIGAGAFSSTRDITRWVGGTRRITPRPDERPRYDAAYRIYRELYERNASLMHDIAATQE
ncbi:MAG TPA: FGGY-family carbohydrate kinase [Spirochaetia bacterium]